MRTRVIILIDSLKKYNPFETSYLLIRKKNGAKAALMLSNDLLLLT